MIDRFADWFAGVLLEKGVITEDELEVQVYGIQTILSNLLSYGVVLRSLGLSAYCHCPQCFLPSIRCCGKQ